MSPPPGFDDIEENYGPGIEDAVGGGEEEGGGGLREGEEGPHMSRELARTLPSSWAGEYGVEREDGAGAGEEEGKSEEEQEEEGEEEEEEEKEGKEEQEEDGEEEEEEVRHFEEGALREAMEELEAEMCRAHVSADRMFAKGDLISFKRDLDPSLRDNTATDDLETGGSEGGEAGEGGGGRGGFTESKSSERGREGGGCGGGGSGCEWERRGSTVRAATAVDDSEIQAAIKELTATETLLVKRVVRSEHDRAVLDVRTLEDETLVVEVTTKGYQLLSRSHDDEGGGGRRGGACVGSYYDDLNSLLMGVSKGYRTAFSNEIFRRLSEIERAADQEQPA